MKSDLYAEVSARIVAELEAGAAPWVKPWSATPGANTPCNAVSNRPYSGCNVVLLWMAQAAGYRTPRFLTFKQARELGGSVRKGQHGTKVYFVKQLQVRDKGADDDTATRLVPMLREYTVFNVEQCENLPAEVVSLGEVKPRNMDEREATIDEFLAGTGATIREGFGEAYYRPGDDVISLPRFERSGTLRSSIRPRFMSLDTGPATSRGWLAICATASATGLMLPRSWSPSSAPPFFVPSSQSTATCATPATSGTGLAS